jgi:tetratricopeptide (TPR) repeat protein
MRSLRLLSPFGLFAILLLPPDVFAQADPMSNVHVRVQVRYSDDTAAPGGVSVALELENGQILEQTQTDSFGRCHFFPNAGPTVYVVHVVHPGYLEAKVRLDSQISQAGLANVTLKPVPRERAPAAPRDASGAPSATVSAMDLTVPEAARKEYELGHQSMRNHDLEGGVAHLRKAIDLHDQFPQAYIMLGMAYNEQKKWKDAQRALEKAVQQDRKATEAYVQLGASLSQLKDFAAALKALNQGLQLSPDAPDAAGVHYELAKAYLALGQWEEANPHATKAVAMEPDIASWHILMGNIDLKKGDGQGALSEFQAYLKLDPNGPAAASILEMIPKIEAVLAKK